MRNIEAEERLLQKIFMVAGLVFLLGLIALAVGAEILVLSYWPDKPSEFWMWQGLWAIVQGIIISSIATTIKKQREKQ
jgi:F0F1-type ATP synthase membrane subunit c/vacuolar-type H+-ATPase subunit K